MDDILMISPETAKLVIEDEHIIKLSKKLGDILNSLPVKYEINILENTFNRVFSKEQTSMIAQIENLIDLRKSQIIKANDPFTFRSLSQCNKHVNNI